MDISVTGKIMLDDNGTIELEDYPANLLLGVPDFEEVKKNEEVKEEKTKITKASKEAK